LLWRSSTAVRPVAVRPNWGPYGPDLGLRAAALHCCSEGQRQRSSSHLPGGGGWERLQREGRWPCRSWENHDVLASTMRCCDCGGVSNMDICPFPMGFEGGVRQYGQKSCPSPVSASDDSACGCRCPPWRRRQGVSALHSISFQFGDVSR
jgi:hypothetical protein